MDLSIEIAGLIQVGDQQKLEEMLREHPELADGKTPQGITLLTLAAYCRNSQAVKLIAARKQETDLFEAAAIGDLNTLKHHIAVNPEGINSYSVDGFTPLGLACFFGHYKTARFLVNEGADVNLPSNNDFKVSPIHSACAISSVEITKLLIDSQADVNAKQTSGVTALHSAAHHGEMGLVKLLVESGAEIKAKDEKKQTPLSMALEKGFDEVVSFLKSSK